MVEVIVEYDYIAKEPDELSIKKGDIIRDVIKKQGGWWEGVLNEKKGVFPDNFVKLVEKDGVTLRNKKDVNRIRQCRVVFSYHPEHEDELSLKVGDVISIVGEEEEGWWRGNLDGKEGVFPSNFVEEIPPEKPKPTIRDDLNRSSEGEGTKAPSLPVKPVRQICEVKYAYKAQNEDELNLKEGDLVTLLNKDGQDPGWWKGELNGKIGVFPDNFVVLLTPGEEKTILNKEKEKPQQGFVAETGAIKPSSIASQRKSLEIKTPPVPGKKPIISIKKSPSSGGSGIFSEIRKKLVDVVDGATGSKSKTETVESNIKETNNNENVFDQVERRPLLPDVRATRAKAPGRRLPTSGVFKDEDIPLPNGDTEHIYSEPVDALNSSSEQEADSKPKLREWEKHKAPWLAEMKLNQAKRTSTSPGPENKPKLAEKPPGEHEESKSAKTSPTEKQVSPIDMSKSTSSIIGKTKNMVNDVEKAPTIRVKPGAAPVLLPTARHTLATNLPLAKDAPATKPPTPLVPKLSPVASKPERKSLQEAKEDTVNPKQYSELLERLQSLENVVEKQWRAIEDLRHKLQVETDMRMLLQEKVSHGLAQM